MQIGTSAHNILIHNYNILEKKYAEEYSIIN